MLLDIKDMLTFLMTFFKGVSNVALVTRTSWNMVDHGTIRINATRVCARIRTLILNTGFIAGTVRVKDTFRSAAKVRVAKKIRQTAADAVWLHTAICADFRDGIGAAWIWLARISWPRWDSYVRLPRFIYKFGLGGVVLY